MFLVEELDCVKRKLVRLSVIVLGYCGTLGPEGVLHVERVLIMTYSVNFLGSVQETGERRNSKQPFCNFHYLDDEDC